MVDNTKLDLAYVSPLNPVRSGLSDYSEAFIPPLSEFVAVTLYSDCGTPSNPVIAERFVVRPVQLLSRYCTQHDLRLYQIGNSPQHRSAFDALRRLPGVVTLHEPFLHHGLYGVSLLRYWREVFYDLGSPDRAAAKRLADCMVVGDLRQMMDTLLIRRLIDSSLGIIVHSRTARRMIEDYCSVHPSCQQYIPPVAVISQLMPIPRLSDPSEGRVEFGLPKKEGLIFGVVGTIQPVKEPHLVLRAFARVATSLAHARLVFVGEMPEDCGVLALARDLGVADQVIFLGRVDPLDRMHRAIAACDVVVNLRQPTIGETSSTALRAMALSRPLIVRDAGWYSELPDRSCLKIGPGAGADELASAMLALATSAETRRQLGEGALRYVQRECDVSTAARRYYEFLQIVYERVCMDLT
jgi:glycosyltransferase involved in cell wall biosynthesis